MNPHRETKIKWPELEETYGPVAWCKFCSRRHPRRKHDLVLADRLAKSGRTVMRWVHKEFA